MACFESITIEKIERANRSLMARPAATRYGAEAFQSKTFSFARAEVEAGLRRAFAQHRQGGLRALRP